MEIVWDGITRAKTLSSDAAAIRSNVADAARAYQWPRLLELLSQHRELINSSRLDGISRYAPLHQAAHGGAPVTVVQQLINLGAWRTLQNACGERPLDVAERRGHSHLLSPLEPTARHRVPLGILLKIQSQFHEVIRGRADHLVQEHALRLPELEPLLELERPKMWFAVPGMYGGFSYWLETTGVAARLTSESWCRIAGGSGQRHEITPDGSRLVDEGFV